MARFMVSIDEKSGVTYVPKELRQEGFVGKVSGLPNACTFTLIRPGTKLPDVARSLRLVIQEIEHRLEMGEE